MDARELIIAISPYHFTGRELASTASIQLADRVVTILPGAPTRAGSERAAASASRYRALVERWAWAEPLLKSGGVAPAWEGADPLADVRAVAEEIETDARWQSLRGLLRVGVLESEVGALDTIATDLLRGGADPGLLIPICAAIDRFAARQGIAAARSGAASIAQKAEQRMGRRVFAVALPLIAQAEPERLVEARERLACNLSVLRQEIAQVALEVSEGGSGEGVQKRIEAGARAHESAFNDIASDLARCDDRFDLAVRISTVSVVGHALPVDAVLRSSAEAAGGMEVGEGIVRGGMVLGLTVRAIGR